MWQNAFQREKQDGMPQNDNMPNVSYINQDYGDYKIPQAVYNQINRKLAMIIDGKINALQLLMFILGGVGLLIGGAIWTAHVEGSLQQNRELILQQNTVITQLAGKISDQDKAFQQSSLSLATIQAQTNYMKDQMNTLISSNNQILSVLGQRPVNR